MRETKIWSGLEHPNILPFLGIADYTGLGACLVSPWIPHGNCMEYLRRPQVVVDQLVLPIVRVFGR